MAEPEFPHEKLTAPELMQLCSELRELLKRSQEAIERTEALLATKLGVDEPTKYVAHGNFDETDNEFFFSRARAMEPGSRPPD